MRFLPAIALMLLAACGDSGAVGAGGAGGSDSGGEGGEGGSPPANEDGDCLDSDQELEAGTDDTKADTDGDGIDDCAELDCVSDPTDANELCYECGWPHNDPGTLVSTGAGEGDVVANIDLIDQCEQPVKLWDFAGEYHILFMTTAW